MTDRLNILADENIPFVEEAFAGVGEVRLRSGRAMNADAVRGADVLLVRSVTPVTRDLLGGSQVQFVGSATIGTDHIDHGYLKKRGITFAHAPGSNAGSVVEYVTAALLRLAVRKGTRLRGKTLGIVGCGSIGGRLAQRAPALGLHVLKNDPPRAEEAEAAGQPHEFVALETVLQEADIVTLHVPLTREGAHPTYHLVDREALAMMASGAWLVNTSRGPAVDNRILRSRLQEGGLGGAVLDVWEGEPTPDPDLVRLVDLATPHIAGYSFDGKVQGTIMLYRALMQHLGRPEQWDCEAVLAPEKALDLAPPDPALPETEGLNWLVRQMYDVGADDRRMRGLLDRPAGERGAYFTELRRTYPRRRTFERYALPAPLVPEAYRPAVREGLQVDLTSMAPCGTPA